MSAPEEEGSACVSRFHNWHPPRIEGQEFGLEVTAAALFRAGMRIDTGGLQVGMTLGGTTRAIGAPLSMACDACAWRSQWIDAAGLSMAVRIRA
jgi:hypothetical protein